MARMAKVPYADIKLLIKIEIEVCKIFNLTLKDLCHKTKQQPVPQARKVVMFVASVCGLPQILIAKNLRVDKSVVSKAIAEYYKQSSIHPAKYICNKVLLAIKPKNCN